MEIDLTGKTAIVTGSSAGIGWGCARGLAEVGATVVLTGRDPSALDGARGRLAAATPGAAIRSVSADLSTADGCRHLVGAEPRCDILVNNLGVFGLKPFFDIPDEDWDRLFHTNVLSGVRLSRAYLPTMMDGGWGRVVFLGSVEGIAVQADQLHYGVMKAAVLALSRGLAKVTQRSGVTVNAVLPGSTMTERVEGTLRKVVERSGGRIEDAGEAMIKRRYPSSIAQRAQTVEEVANLVVYLCSTKSSATTGSALRADGGIIDTIC